MAHPQVILYNPRSSAPCKPILPNSLLALAAMIEGGWDYQIVDGNLEDDPLSTLHGLLQNAEDPWLAVTVMPGPQLSLAVPHCRELKSRHPNLRVVWGGYFPTQHFAACLESDAVDFVIRGHGELSFRELLDGIRKGSEIGSIPGLARRESDSGQILTSGLAPVPNPDALPDFPYHRIPLERYARSTFLGARTFSCHTSYGCPFRCNFCAVVNMVDGKWLAQSAQRVAETVQFLARHGGADAIEFHDNNFFVSERRTAEFCERIQDLEISWWGEARIDTLLGYSSRSWDLMKQSGLRIVFLGAESASDEVLRRMDKGGTAKAELAIEIARRCREYDIIPEFSFMLGNPPDAEADAERTMQFIRRLKQVNPVSEIILYLYTPVPLAGKLYEEASQQGFQFPTRLDEWIREDWLDFAQRRSQELPWISNQLRTRLRDFQRVLNAYYPTRTDPNLTRARRKLLRLVSSWRYRLGIYRYPLELRALHKWMRYQRPETSGF